MSGGRECCPWGWQLPGFMREETRPPPRHPFPRSGNMAPRECIWCGSSGHWCWLCSLILHPDALYLQYSMRVGNPPKRFSDMALGTPWKQRTLKRKQLRRGDRHGGFSEAYYRLPGRGIPLMWVLELLLLGESLSVTETSFPPMEMMFVTSSLLSLPVWFTLDSTLSRSLLLGNYSSFIECVLSVCDWPPTQPTLRDSERPPRCPASTALTNTSCKRFLSILWLSSPLTSDQGLANYGPEHKFGHWPVCLLKKKFFLLWQNICNI